jgi:hypothetical protein
MTRSLGQRALTYVGFYPFFLGGSTSSTFWGGDVYIGAQRK